LSLALDRPVIRDFVVHIQRLEVIISHADTDSIVKYLAIAFRFLCYLRLDRKDMLVTNDFERWPVAFAPLRATLIALALKARNQQYLAKWPPSGIGLAELSPAHADEALEHSLGRPNVVTTFAGSESV
jgi:hypothetical protein